jgi:protocatechuate 3,4-dioxygenase beta subunit
MRPKLSRREALGALALGVLLPGCGEDDDRVNSCRVTSERAEGPFYVDTDSLRRDIREGRPGVPLLLELTVREAETCRPLRDAVVDVWHCDARGDYSAGPERFLRGTQVSDRGGKVEFMTIYPGWYPGRTPHIHAKVRLDRREALTTQLFFEDRASAAIYRDRRYRRDAPQEVNNSADGIFDPDLVMGTRRTGRGLIGSMTFDVERA